MGSGKEIHAAIKIKNDRKYIDLLVDTFGIDFSTIKEKDYLTAHVMADDYSLIRFALQYYDNVEIISPPSLIAKLTEIGDIIKNKYT